ncbi:glycosyltransferase [Bradyrhizobium sp. USDA 4449]
MLHGFLGDAEARQIIDASDLYLCASYEEGLGLPLLEVQYAGLPIVAPDDAVFREVLGASGVYVQPDQPKDAARIIAQVLADAKWRSIGAAASIANVARWNALANNDRENVIGFLKALASGANDSPPIRNPAK